MATDPRAMIHDAPMSRFQWGVVATMVGLNALDGFDVLSISFAAPGIAAEWGIDRAALGLVLRWNWWAWRSGRCCWAASPTGWAGAPPSCRAWG